MQFRGIIVGPLGGAILVDTLERVEVRWHRVDRCTAPLAAPTRRASVAQ
jgi:hypothetical protein